MEKYQICKHTMGFPCISEKKGKSCYGILASTSDLASSSIEIDIEVDQVLEYLRESFAVDSSQRFHYEFRASSDIENGTGKIEFVKIPISDNQNNNKSLEFKLLCEIQNLSEEGKTKISPTNLNTYTLLQNSFADAGKWVD